MADLELTGKPAGGLPAGQETVMINLDNFARLARQRS